MENFSDAGNNTVFLFDYSNAEYDQFCNKETVVIVGSITVPFFFIIVIILSLVGNILVLLILVLYETLRSLTNIFIFNLAVSDLMFTLGLPFWSWYYVWGWTFGDAMCKGVNFVFSAGFYSSVVFLMLMTIQRFLAVVYPLCDWERGWIFATILILGAWALSFALALPALLFSEVMPDPENNANLYCEYNSHDVILGVTYEQNAFLFFAFIVISFCYLRILQTVHKSRSRKRHKTIRLVFCIVTVFFVGWAPYNIVKFLQTLTILQVHPFNECDVTDHLEYAYYACRLVAYSHCCLNPVFYVFVGVKFRGHLKMTVQKLFRFQIKLNPKQPRTTPVQGSQGSLY